MSIASECKKKGAGARRQDMWEETETLISQCQSNDSSECCSTAVRASCVAGPVFDMLKITKRTDVKVIKHYSTTQLLVCLAGRKTQQRP